MITRIFQDILDKIYDNKKVLSIGAALSLFLFVLLYSLFNDGMYVKLFYMNEKMNKLAFEYREVASDAKRELRLKNVIDDLLLGPVNVKLKNQFNRESKLLSLVMIKNDVYLDFNKKTFQDVTNPRLCVYSILETLSFCDRNIGKVYIFIDGISYRYIGDLGPIDVGLRADYKYLSK